MILNLLKYIQPFFLKRCKGNNWANKINSIIVHTYLELSWKKHV